MRGIPATLSVLVILAGCGGGAGDDVGDDVTFESVPLGCEQAVARFEAQLEGISFDSASLADMQAYQRHRTGATDFLSRAECDGEFWAAADGTACAVLTSADPEPGAGGVLDTAREFACSGGGEVVAADDCGALVDRYADVMDEEYDRIVDETGVDDAVELLALPQFTPSPEAVETLRRLDEEGRVACGPSPWRNSLDDVRRDSLDAHRPWPGT